MARGRSSRGRTFTHKGKRFQWFGFQNSNVVIDSAAVDNFVIVPTNDGVSEQSAATLVRTVISLTVAS